MNELYHHGIKGMKWGVRRYQNPDGSLTAAGKRKYRKAVTRYVNAEKQARTIDERMKAYSKLEDSFRKHAVSCKEAVDKHWSAMERMHEYQKPYLDEWGRLNDAYKSKHKSIYTEDDIPDKDREAIQRQAAKNVGYDEKEYKRLRADFEKARDNAERECKKVADSILEKYGDTPVLNEGYMNEQKTRDIVSDVLYRLNWQDHRK